VRFVEDPRDEKDAADRIYAEHTSAWQRKRNLYKLYLDHFPDMLARMRECRTRPASDARAASSSSSASAAACGRIVLRATRRCA
jgi:hypothetical protein